MRDPNGLLVELQTGIAELTTSEKWTQYLDVQSRFYSYSPNNVMLIQLQNPYATRVAGYQGVASTRPSGDGPGDGATNPRPDEVQAG